MAMRMVIFVGSVLLILGVVNAGQGKGLGLLHRPDPDNAPAMARWLGFSNSWGEQKYSIFQRWASRGWDWKTIFLLVSGLDPTPIELEHDLRCSLSLSEASLGTCGDTDVENPTCARLTLSGKIVEISKDDNEAAFATRALFSKHPEMEGWPKGHVWRIYNLEIEDLFLVDYYGGAKPLPVEDH